MSKTTTKTPLGAGQPSAVAVRTAQAIREFQTPPTVNPDRGEYWNGIAAIIDRETGVADLLAACEAGLTKIQLLCQELGRPTDVEAAILEAAIAQAKA